MTGFIAVHCGAGYHKSALHTKYKRLCRKACEAASVILNAGGSAMFACQAAIMVLEDDPLTNAGYGSNLTISGAVECDASIMDGETLNFGACGAVQGVKYPISLAYQLCHDQSKERPLGLIPPSLLVGNGARQYAKNANLALINRKKLISKKALLHYKKYKAHFKKYSVNDRLLDTVGAVCVDQKGNVASACSSGGIGLKYDGRVGQAAMYASGVWADSFDKKEPAVAVTTSGAGEYLVKTLLAKELATSIKNNDCPVTAFHKTMQQDFIESKYLAYVPEKLGGALALHILPSGHGELMWGHTSRTMGFAYMDTSKEKSVGVMSELPKDLEGISTVISGISFKINLQSC